MGSYEEARAELTAHPRRWLVTGVAGFIGSHLLEALLELEQEVVGLDNFMTGQQRNLDEVCEAVGSARAGRFRFIEGDIRDRAVCTTACAGVDIVLHQAALGSVPRSIADPATTHAVNLDGFVNMLEGARAAGISRFVYASSSSVYGDDPTLPKVEAITGRVLSPYAATKRANEVYAEAYQACFDMTCVGLRYFNVFGPRQDPQGPYAAVIPRWIGQMLSGEACVIHGDGLTSRDFSYVANTVQANVLAALAPIDAAAVYNVGCGGRTTLDALYAVIREQVDRLRPGAREEVEHTDFRPGDVRHSLASTALAERELGYRPTHSVGDGMALTVDWYVRQQV